MQPMNRHLVDDRGGHRSKVRVAPLSTVWAVAVVVWAGAGAVVAADAPDTSPASIPTTSPSSAPSAVPTSRPAPTSKISAEAAALKGMSLEELMNLEVGTVTTASKQPEKANEAPATAIVITAQDIRNRGYSNIVDVLRDLPGMETVENYYTEIGTLVPVRGISGNNLIIVLVNGMRVNPPGGEFFPFGSDFSVRDAEQVEVVYGPGSTLYGADAISAVINVKTKKPVSGQLGELVIDGGLYSEREGFLSFGKTFTRENISLTGYFQYHDSNLTPIDKEYPGYWSQYAQVSENTRPFDLGNPPFREDYGINGFMQVEGENWSVQGWYRQDERSSAQAYNPESLGFLKQAIWGDSSLVVEGRHTLPISSTVKLESALTYNRYEIAPNTRFVEPINGNWFFTDNKYGVGSSLDLEETLRWQVTPKVSFLAGVEAGAYDIIPKSTIPGGANVNGNVVEEGLADPLEYTAPGAAAPTVVNRVSRYRYQTYAQYLELGWQLTPKMKALAGARLTEDTRLSETPLTPRASLIYTLTDKLTAKYIYTQAYVAPAPYFEAQTYDDGVHLSIPNNHLDAEKASSNEINLNYAEKNFNVGISPYYGQQSNLIIPSYSNTPANDVYVNGTDMVTEVSPNRTVIGQRILTHTANGGRSHNDGFDLYGRAVFGNVSPWASYSYTDFEQKVGAMTTGLPGISRHNGRLGATWAVTPKIFITPSLVIRSRPENVTTPGALGHDLDLPYEVNLNMAYRPTDRLEFFVEVRNLTNHKYALVDITGDAYPQETINGVIGMRLSY